MKHYDAKLHVKGKSIFTSDLPEPAGTLHAYVFTSPSAHGEILSLNTDQALASTGVVKVLTASDIPGENQIGNILMDEPLLGEREVHFIGQPLAVVLADSYANARKAAGMISAEIRELEAVSDPRKACENGQLLTPPRTFSCGDVQEARKNCTFIISGTAETGGQEHLYLETQSALTVPGEDGTFRITSSTQGPSYVQKISARVLGIPIHSVEVDVPRLGGAFGGKEDQATPWAVITALGSWATGKPVKLVLNRHDDLINTGKRHPYISDFTIGLTDQGKILLWEVDYFQNSGASSDLSTAILERTLFHSTASYFIPNVRATGCCCRTNLAPNTAFRGFGAPQAMFVMEAAIHKASAVSGINTETIQEINLLKKGDSFHYGMEYSADEVRTSWDQCRTFLESCRADTDEFNGKNRWMKKGISMMPVCFGISFTTTFLNQASALVHVYTDGSVGISTGAVEMGQGVNSRIRQTAAMSFGIPVGNIRMESANTTRNANTSPTAASSGADMNGNATRLACREILKRILAGAAEEMNCSPEQLSMENSVLLLDGNSTGKSWKSLITSSYMKRISLSEHSHYATPGIHFDRKTEKGAPFAYHVAGTALTEVTVDCLLGTYRVDRVRIVHHGGTQLNPVIDQGQVEGALVQGIGWVTMEELAWDPKSKRLLTDALATYKVPDIQFTPEIQVSFPPGEKLPENVGLRGSKAIGEPPFMYGIGTWFAIAGAMKSFSGDIQTEYTAPMTPERVLMTLRKAR